MHELILAVLRKMAGEGSFAFTLLIFRIPSVMTTLQRASEFSSDRRPWTLARDTEGRHLNMAMSVWATGKYPIGRKGLKESQDDKSSSSATFLKRQRVTASG